MKRMPKAKKASQNREDRRQREIAAKLKLLGEVSREVYVAMGVYRLCKRPGDFADIAMTYIPRLAKLLDVLDPSAPTVMPDGSLVEKKGGGS